LLFNSPLSSEKADRLVQLLELNPAQRVLDAGCGTGEFLLRVIEKYSVQGLGVDRDAACIATAQESAAERGLSARVEFRATDMSELTKNDLTAERGAFDLGICIGSTHAFGLGEVAYPNAIERLCKLVRPSGLILLGESYWKQEPAAEYRQLLGEPIGIYRDHAANIAFAEARGLHCLYATVSNDDEWDDFEWSHQRKIQRQAEANPADPALAKRLAGARQWRDGYLRWGRTTMGFGMYLFRVVSS
jgi:SAM-dependent methyltransferase